MTGRSSRIVRVGSQVVYAMRAKAESSDMESLNMKARPARMTRCFAMFQLMLVGLLRGSCICVAHALQAAPKLNCPMPVCPQSAACMTL